MPVPSAKGTARMSALLIRRGPGQLVSGLQCRIMKLDCDSLANSLLHGGPKIIADIRSKPFIIPRADAGDSSIDRHATGEHPTDIYSISYASSCCHHPSTRLQGMLPGINASCDRWLSHQILFLQIVVGSPRILVWLNLCVQDGIRV